jgi:predicted methyltransferase
MAQSGFVTPIGAQGEATYIQAAIDNIGRPRTDKARDAALKPADAIRFSGMKPGDKVADFVPGNAYYTRMFSYLVGPRGHVYALVPRILPPGTMAGPGCGPRGGPILAETLFAMQALKGEYQNLDVLCESTTSFSLPEQLDVAWTSYGYHDLQSANQDRMVELTRNMFAALKPGGTLIVIDRGETASVKTELAAAGFVLDAENQTDQFMLRFKKPLSATGNKRLDRDKALARWYGNTFRLGSPERWNRSVFYTADGNYHEFAANDLNVMQSGTVFFDANGLVCYLKAYPAAERGNTGCHPFDKEHQNAVVGDNFDEVANGRASPVGLVAGQHYPPAP